MSWMEFIVEILGKLVWPAVVVFAVISLRDPLSRLIPLAKKLKYKDLELEFGESIKEVAKKAQGAFPELKHDQKALLIASADNLPSSSVLESWQVVDEAAEKLIRSKRSDVDLYINTRYKLIENILVTGNIIDTKKGKLFSELRQLRNKVAHASGYEVGKAEAIQYIELCFKLAEHFNAITDGSNGRTDDARQ